MPTLENPRYEAFAQAHAKSALLIDAYESAGFVRHRGQPSLLALQDEVAERIAEFRALQTDKENVSPFGLLASLQRIIKAGEVSENPTLVNAAPVAILDAPRLQVELASHCEYERKHLNKVFNDLVAEEKTVERPSPPPEAPAAAPPPPRQRPSVAPRAPHGLLASAARSPLALPGLSTAPSQGMAARNWR